MQELLKRSSWRNAEACLTSRNAVQETQKHATDEVDTDNLEISDPNACENLSDQELSGRMHLVRIRPSVFKENFLFTRKLYVKHSNIRDGPRAIC